MLGSLRLRRKKEFMEDVARWLAERPLQDSVKTLFAAFCPMIVQSGVPLSRCSLALEVLHPEVSGWQHIWTHESQSLRKSDRANAATSHAYLNSPTRIVDETAQPFRRRLNEPLQDMPLLEELWSEGATDYVMYPLPFLDRSRTAVISFATDNTGGFDDTHLERLELASKILSPYVERHVLRRIATDLLDTYVGPRAGQRIIEGRVDRGGLELIEAAIWFADLRGFTVLSEQTDIPDVLRYLNSWFETIGEVVEAHGGEILKFMGDAVLAIFPTTAEHDRAGACRMALAAAQELGRRTDTANAERRERGQAPVTHGLALHMGEVAYGNVGASRRLDFTVIGPAVNRASRLLELAKSLDRLVLISDTIAREVDIPLVDLGKYRLRDIEHEQHVFTLSQS